MKRPALVLALLSSSGSLLPVGNALAFDNHDDDYGHHHRSEHMRSYNDETTAYAEVTRVTPIREEVEVRTPHQDCYNVEVQHDGNNGNGGAVVGAVAGGLLGHAAGHNSNSRKLDTVAGAIVGAVAGKELTKDDGSAPTTEQRCETRDEVNYEDRTVGYDVTYRYFGHDYTTRMDHDPGDRIRVIVDVRPAP